MNNEYRKTCFTSCLIRELQTKTSYHHTPIRMAKFFFYKMTTPNAGEIREEQKLLLIADGNANVIATLEGSLAVSYKATDNS